MKNRRRNSSLKLKVLGCKGVLWSSGAIRFGRPSDHVRVEAVSTQQMNIEIELMYTSDGRNVVVEGSCSNDLSWSNRPPPFTFREVKQSGVQFAAAGRRYRHVLALLPARNRVQSTEMKSSKIHEQANWLATTALCKSQPK